MNAPSNTPVILLVDDDPAILLTVGDRLRSEGYAVILAASSEDALESLAHRKADLVVLDISIPGLGGMGFLKKAAQDPECGSTPVLIFTARANLKEFFDATGVAGFVAKTSTPELLLSAIKSILANRITAPKPSPQPATAHKIMIVEDDEAIRHHLVRLFKNHGMDPHPLATPGDVIAASTNHQPHAILLKYLLPGYSGPAIARLLGDTHATRQIPVILYDDSGIHLHMDIPFTNVAKFIPAPSDAEFIKAVNHVLART
jgi:CheY-like chemotaxis protein